MKDTFKLMSTDFTHTRAVVKTDGYDDTIVDVHPHGECIKDERNEAPARLYLVDVYYGPEDVPNLSMSVEEAVNVAKAILAAVKESGAE